MLKNPLLISGICLLLSMVLVLLLLWPKYQDIQILEEKIEWKETDLETQTVYFENLENISGRLKEHQEQLSKIDSALPESLFLPEILNFIQYSASQSGLLLKDISSITTIIPSLSPQDLEAGFEGEEIDSVNNKVKETRINLKFSGDYPSFKNFLLILEKSTRLFGFQDITFSRTEESTEFDLIIKVYSY